MDHPEPFGVEATLAFAQIFNFDKIPKHRQLAQRIIRGFIVKTWISIRRQHIVMRSNGHSSLIPEFDNIMKNKFIDMLSLIESECYELCDEIDTLFA